ncbi:MAG: PorP/SprF family type IX secretion system membrane protein [Bacteroidetes bacterium]|nr:PorP/SprF family type IX secretion system membrane protein [Bacteroidota bacterium]
MNKIKNILIVFLLSIIQLKAQDARYAHSYANPLRINPAIMGASNNAKFMLNYRSQWASIDKGFKTASFSAIYPIFLVDNKGKVDVGLAIMNDKAGAFSTTDVSLAFDFSKEIAPNNNLCFSLIGGFVQKKIDLGNQTFDAQYINGTFNSSNSTNELVIDSKINYADIGFGFMWFYNPNRSSSKLNAYAGFAGYHLNQPNQTLIESNGKLPARFAYQGGLKFFGDNKIDISPNVRVNYQKGNTEIASGLYVDYNFQSNMKLVVGAWYRMHDAIAFLVGYEHKNLMVGYSYDMVNSGLERVVSSVNAHEITLCYKFLRKSKNTAAFGSEGENVKVSDLSSTPFSNF